MIFTLALGIFGFFGYKQIRNSADSIAQASANEYLKNHAKQMVDDAVARAMPRVAEQASDSSANRSIIKGKLKKKEEKDD